MKLTCYLQETPVQEDELLEGVAEVTLEEAPEVTVPLVPQPGVVQDEGRKAGEILDLKRRLETAAEELRVNHVETVVLEDKLEDVTSRVLVAKLAIMRKQEELQVLQSEELEALRVQEALCKERRELDRQKARKLVLSSTMLADLTNLLMGSVAFASADVRDKVTSTGAARRAEAEKKEAAVKKQKEEEAEAKKAKMEAEAKARQERLAKVKEASRVRNERDRRGWAEPAPRPQVAARVEEGRSVQEGGMPEAWPMVRVGKLDTPQNFELYK